MGGHGTWFLGATYADKWAAIAPCAGYPTLKAYGSADGLIPDSAGSPIEQMLLRSGNQSDVPRLGSNYKPLGIYIFHGDEDETVPVSYARQMRKLLADFHTDMSYYEYPGGGHWFGDKSFTGIMEARIYLAISKKCPCYILVILCYVTRAVKKLRLPYCQLVIVYSFRRPSFIFQNIA